ncbi:hypothetical protein [Nocardioides flavescens]|uniref:DUF5666 domain-containing protein n=1 Tax=Nocardioides flavescens TaxID=2691959 RepID=A0A6L7EWM3_9ACTN|nr:hypothetical protein [Nocardioides flavescens]MXG91150.1 hypothetical protein [Nocardioides flavescens]
MTDPTDRPDDEAWLAEPPRRSRVRRLLVALLLASCVFCAGATVQQRWGSTTAALPAGGATGAAGAMGRMGQGGPPGAASTDTESTGSASSTTTPSQDDAPAVIGTVTATDGTTWTVTDLGGTAHQVVVTADLRVGAGTTVSVVGTTDAQGLVTATSVTVR